jgi:hypothetical protein
MRKLCSHKRNEDTTYNVPVPSRPIPVPTQRVPPNEVEGDEYKTRLMFYGTLDETLK